MPLPQADEQWQRAMRARTRNVMGRRALQKALLVCILATVKALRAPTPALRSTHGRRYAANVWDDLPEPCRQALDARGLAAPLPVQTRSYAPVFEGLDAVVQSPTATGKTKSPDNDELTSTRKQMLQSHKRHHRDHCRSWQQ